MLQGLGDHVLGVYCERGHDPAFWAEPFNAVSNAAFLVAAAFALARFREDGAARLLGALIAVIGVGSFLFHSFATRWALIADVGPIQIFIALYFFLAMRRMAGLGPWAACAATAAFMAAAAALPSLFPRSEPWIGLGGYLGGLIGLIGLAAALALKDDAGRRNAGRLAAIALLFTVSLGFRSVDGAVCAGLSTGTHALWHILNAIVLYTLVATLAKSRRDFV